MLRRFCARPHFALALLPLLAACGDATSGASEATAGTSSTTSGSTSTTGAPTTSTTGAPTTGPTGTGASTGASTSASTGASTSTGATTSATTGAITSATTDATTDVSTGTTAPDTTTTTGTTGDPPCMQGTIVCEGDVAKVCDGMGGFESEESCPKVCAPGLGCVECVPGEGMCSGDVATICSDDGSGFVDEYCDPVQGVSCQDGQCVGACAKSNLGTSYIGCDYYAVVTPNVVTTNFTFAVVVSNVSDTDAELTVTRGPNTVLETVVPAGTVEVIPLPWVQNLKAGAQSRIVVDGAYRIRSTQPVTLYQYS
ncbi:MAG TPA: hypothetical protein VIK91_02645, partial [Nannocystis sp.]